MEPRMPVSQQPPPSMVGNPQPIYGQPQPNKFGANGHGQYMQQPLRPPNFQATNRVCRNVPPAASIGAKVHQMEGMSEYPPEGLMQINSPAMSTTMNLPGDPGIQSGYQRGPQLYPYQNPNMQTGPNIRPPHVSPQQQPVYNQMTGQLPMDMMPQQRFQAPMQGPRFPNDSEMQQVPVGDPTLGGASFDNSGFGLKVRPIPPPLQIPQQQQQALFNPQPLPINSPTVSLPSQQKSLPVTPSSMSNMETSESYRQQSRQPIPSSQAQPVGMMPQQPQLSSPQQPMGSLGSFTIPPQGATCVNCSGDLCEPPLQAPSPNSNSNQPYPPIQCEAGCRGWYHLPCSGLTLEAFLLLKAESNFVEWLCSPCASQAAPNISYLRPRNLSAH
ncbi:unnamed protein product [Rodentolepis nana]|uniref:PHD domain-containing protein n=1 Tax=Rodentolepis nana TaxID=102285 RepID=A0A0R3TPK0_RODNA|nr:unnamed protein product [Rodentolepis nana]